MAWARSSRSRSRRSPAPKLELFVINFVKDKMTLRVPTAKAASVGMRKLAEGALVKRALETLKGRARVKRTMWSRRAQEYEAKINSGDIVAIAEVVRDLFRSEIAARAVLLGASALRGRARPALARDRCRAAHHRDRGDQGDRGARSPRVRAAARPSRPKSWSRTRRRNARSSSESNSEARRRRRAFSFVVGDAFAAAPAGCRNCSGADPAKCVRRMRELRVRTAKISRSSHIVASICRRHLRVIGRSQTGVCV